MTIKQTYKQIEWVLYHYRAIARAVRDRRLEKVTTKHGGGGRGISDPTGATVIKMNQPIARIRIGIGRKAHTVIKPETWLSVVDNTLARQEAIRQRAFVMRYIQGKSVIETAMECYAQQRTIYGWCREFVSEVAIEAARKKLI